MFGESSPDALSTISFLQGKLINNYDAMTQLAFVFGKARVALMRARTLPKFELQAALLAARLRDEVHRALSLTIDRTFMWSDNSTVPQWVYSLEKQPIFVANQVCEILELTTIDEWHYSLQLLLNSSWLTGPDFRNIRFPFQTPRSTF